MTSLRRIAGVVTMTAGLAATTTPALAHHMMGGRMPSTLMEGLLSGLGHPIIGIDHFLFVVGVGLLGGILGRRLLLPLAFTTGTLGGVAIHLAGIGIVFAEPAIVGSVGLMAVAVVKGARLRAVPAAMLVTSAGLLHGYAYAEGIVGAEPTPLYAYLIGFAAIQLVIAFTAGNAWQALERRGSWLATTVLRGASVAMTLFVVVEVGRMALNM